MALRSARLTGDPVLEQCLAGRHRMLAGEDNLSVGRVQSALLDLGFSVGPQGVDGIFGPATGTAVSAYKDSRGLSPSDPVVGVGTTQTLDDELLNEPPQLLGEFRSSVLSHRLEPFAARELNLMHQAAFDSWRHMLARFALTGLGSGQLLGIVAMSRFEDLRGPFLQVADPVQPGGLGAADYFDRMRPSAGASGETVNFTSGGQVRSWIALEDKLILGRSVNTLAATGQTAPESLLSTLCHELAHALNAVGQESLLALSDDDGEVYADTLLAVQRSSATGVPTALTTAAFVEEMCGRHTAWVVGQEMAGTPGELAVRLLDAARLAAGAGFYFAKVSRSVWDRNGYGDGINAQGETIRNLQLDRWLRLTATQTFSTNPDQNALAVDVVMAAAQFCADQALDPTGFPEEDGLYPIPRDFH